MLYRDERSRRNLFCYSVPSLEIICFIVCTAVTPVHIFVYFSKQIRIFNAQQNVNQLYSNDKLQEMDKVGQSGNLHKEGKLSQGGLLYNSHLQKNSSRPPYQN